MKFPVVGPGKSHWPTKPMCPICKNTKILEPHSMAVLTAGALKMNRKKDEGTMSKDLDGFLSLTWHGAHDQGQGTDREIGCIVDIFNEVPGGQADLYFCSTKCLRQFLNTCVDELEGKIAKKKKGSNQAL